MIAPAVVALALLAAPTPSLRAMVRASCAQPPEGHDAFTREEKAQLRAKCLEAGAGAAWLDRLRNRRVPIEVGAGGVALVRHGGFFTGGTLRIGLLLDGVRVGVDGSLLAGSGIVGTANAALGVPFAVGEWQLRPSALFGYVYSDAAYPRYVKHSGASGGLRLELLTPGRVGSFCLDGGLARPLAGDLPAFWQTTGWFSASLVWHFL